MAETGKDQEIWMELDSKGLKVKEGVIQDATLITADRATPRQINPEGQKHKHAETKKRPGPKK